MSCTRVLDDRDKTAVKLEELEETSKSLNRIEKELILENYPREVKDINQIRASMHDDCITTKIALHKHTGTTETNQETREAPIEALVNIPTNLHVIKNTWATFDGTLKKWQWFRDKFVAAVHEEWSMREGWTVLATGMGI